MVGDGRANCASLGPLEKSILHACGWIQTARGIGLAQLSRRMAVVAAWLRISLGLGFVEFVTKMYVLLLVSSSADKSYALCAASEYDHETLVVN
jgi:hypothetical protein